MIETADIGWSESFSLLPSPFSLLPSPRYLRYLRSGLFALAPGAGGGFVDGMAKTIFERIIAREIPAKIEHEDDVCVVLHDIQPQAPVHLLIVPKKVITRVGEATAADQATLGHLLLVAGEIARKLQLAHGFRLVINNGPHASESVPHLHVHLLAKRQMNWPPG